MPPAIELDGVSTSYPTRPGGRAKGELRLADVTLTLEPGQLCALLGPNGAGKSTLIRVVAGVLSASTGVLKLLGDDAARLTRNERARRVAVVPQRSEVALGFSVQEVVAMGRAPHQDGLLREKRRDREAVAAAMATCKLESIAHRPVAELSGGEQKRVHIARALAQQAPILLLDEAATHLDVHHALSLYELIRQQVSAQQLACLAAMHDLDAAARYADRVVLLKAGRVVADGATAEVMTAELLSDTFDAQIEVGELPSGMPYVAAVSAR